IAQSFSGGNGIQRYFQITPATNTSLDATLRFVYFDSELNGLNESDLELFKSIDSGMTWTNEGFTSKDIGDNYIELTGINSFSRWSTTTMNTFPVGWLGFHAFPEESAVLCEWITGFEQNTHYFQVEKSANGVDFEAIGKVQASGASSEELIYQFTDRNPHKGKSWYQIRQIDLDGSFSLSQVEEIVFSGKEISIYPNPAREFINISLPETGHSRIELINLLGQIIAYWEEEKTTIQLNTEPFPKGVYLIKIYQNGNIYPQKIRIH
ncbi:MAG: T9SS type A sorting domain-containing protein, partial [Bacteroidetes bacterium]|nr:T9SS type A sorting domain-containing protein [Bacteroidota bacterium]